MPRCAPFINQVRYNKKTLFLLACFILDLIFSIILFISFGHGLSSIKKGAADMLLLYTLRIFCSSTFIYGAIKLGRKEFHLKHPSFFSSFFLWRPHGYRVVTVEDNEGGKKDDDRTTLATKTADRWRRGLSTAIYILFTFCLIFTGVKCVILEFSEGSSILVQQIAMIALVGLMNIELFLSREIVSFYTTDVAYLYPMLHVHPLYSSSRKDIEGSRYCDACRESLFGESLECTDCDFDLCQDCAKKDKDKLDGLIRNDAGLVVAQQFTTLIYLKQILIFAKRHIVVICFALLFLLMSAIADLLIPNLQGNILDQVIKVDMNAFHNYIVVYIIVTLLLGLFSAIQTYCFQLVGKKMLYDIQVALFHNVIQQDIAFFDGMPTGNIVSRLCYDADAMISPANEVLSSYLSAIVQLIGGLLMCLYTSWRLSILAFTTIGPITLVYREYAKYSEALETNMWNMLSKANNVVTETFHNIRTVRAFSQEPAQEARYVEARRAAMRSQLKSAGYQAVTTLFTLYMQDAISVLVLSYGGLLVMQHSNVLSIGSLITFQLYWIAINFSYESLTKTAAAFTKAGGAAGHILQLLACRPAIDPLIGDICPGISGDIELLNVTYFYQMRPSQIILKELNLHIKAGQVCAIVGKSGGGKSTIINLLLRFYDPKGGAIRVDGKDLRTLNPVSYRAHIGVVSQDTQLMNESILENITLSKNGGGYTMEQVHEAAKKANAHEFILANEDGYNTRVGENGFRLSGGQKQRIALARAFLKQPSLLLLDEATSSLDAESERLVQEAIDKLIAERKCTVVLVAHRLSTVMGADQIVVLDNGVIVESGTHEVLMGKEGVYAKLVTTQTRKYRNLVQDEEEMEDNKK